MDLELLASKRELNSSPERLQRAVYLNLIDEWEGGRRTINLMASLRCITQSLCEAFPLHEHEEWRKNVRRLDREWTNELKVRAERTAPYDAATGEMDGAPRGGTRPTTAGAL
jgi:hypothetical protein